MAGRHTHTCSIAGFLNVFGDAWSLLIVREALYGATRFSEFQRNTGAAKNLLSERLSTLVDHGILEKVDIGTAGPRYAYHPTAKCETLRPLLAHVVLWANDNLYSHGTEPTHVVDAETGTQIRSFAPSAARTSDNGPTCACRVIAGPGANEAARKRLALAK